MTSETIVAGRVRTSLYLHSYWLHLRHTLHGLARPYTLKPTTIPTLYFVYHLNPSHHIWLFSHII
jgi:hypothetical protein